MRCRRNAANSSCTILNASPTAVTTHKQANARNQIVGQIHAQAAPAVDGGVPGLPSDAPVFEEPPKPPLFTVASVIRLVILLAILGVAVKIVYYVYLRE